ncbi:hypothetical protein CGRA01v4_08924 [Colletotrichum graminicola]|uniref:2EXR domain-containing protein n=1 Tax=Colletotrichum graminicola (strain M1.001 / M2 / FGSC 10212) TaxID=645133 RepID=E3Q7G8_COLGM|nr:uncharacterized protein GLRG_02626 [Colletotrichum graminicola M1.001]EFQ26806.1 hypothetical protein GLRG_02626 [Colletotrichum graminicola M1.001]WDK17641.1 hypothetical protein CGRA01v4_08924 [Colletotrichum graminicola]
MARFELFSSLPKELRLTIWRTTLAGQGRLVTVAPNRELLACRSGLPVISAVNRESRHEFLRLYIRLHDDSGARPGSTRSGTDTVEDHVYFNPRVDALLIGSATKTGSALKSSGGLGGMLLFARCPVGTLVDAPALPRPAREKVRKVHLYDLNPSRRMEMDPSLRNRRLRWGPERPGPIPLPGLRFPRLDTVFIVTLHASFWVGNFKSHGRRGRHFRYVVPSNQVYYQVTEMDYGECFGGIRPASRIPDECLKPTPGQTRAVRVDIIHSDDLDWVTEGWHAICNADDFCHETWHMVVEYIAIRLGKEDE